MINAPLSNPVLIFGLAMLIFLIAPMVMRKFNIPGIIGLILAGVVVGPNGLGVLERDTTIVLLGTVGLLYIIFIAGLEIDLDGFNKYKQRSILFGSLSFAIPFILGIMLMIGLGYSLLAAVLLGSVLGSHTLLAYPIASRFGISKNKAVTTTVGGTIMTDTLALSVLAVIAAITAGELTSVFWITFVVSFGLYVAGILVFVPMLAKLFFRNLSSSEGTVEFTFVMTVLFVSAYLASVIGLEPIIGGFLAGLALNRFVLESSPLMNRIKFMGNSLFIPFFLLSVGMLMDIRVLLEEPAAWLKAGLIVVFVHIGKFAAAWVTGKIYRYSIEEMKLIFGLSIPQAVATLAATLVGYDLGLFDDLTVNAVILMILVTCIVGPYMVEKYARKIVMHEQLKPYEPNDSPTRILIPIANPNTMESLLDLAFILRGTQQEPLYPLSVVRGKNGFSAGKVVVAEKLLERAADYAAGAEVPIHQLTRVDQNVVAGITKAMEETRITTVILGWNGKLATPQRIFGGILDQMLDRTNEMVLVAKIGAPVNTTKQVVVILPYGVNHKTGYYESVKMIKTLAHHIGASLLSIVINGDTASYQKDFKKVKPEVSMKFVYSPAWNDAHKQYINTLRKDDLVVVMSARRGTIAWHPQLERMPRVLSHSIVDSFIMLYPPEPKFVDERGARGTEVPKSILPPSAYED